jgi:hypothetical protein
MQSGYHNLPVINGTDQMQGADYKAKNSTFKATAKTAVFATDIAGAYTEQANVKSWIRSYTLNRGKSFTISDRFELGKISGTTSSNLITSCKVTQVKSGLLRFDGDGFSLQMTYSPAAVTPEIEFIEVTDRSLKRYWPDGVTRVKLLFNKPSLKGNQSVTFTPVK